MKALYSRKELHEKSVKNNVTPLQRYLHRFKNEREKVRKQKHHEKDYLFQAMSCLFNSEDKKAFDLFDIPEAKEFVFYKIILTHADGVMVFGGKLRSASGQFLTPNEKRKNKRFFYEYLSKWKNQILKEEGAYCHCINVELNDKFKELEGYARQNNKSEEYIKAKRILIYALFFNLYYNVKLFFNELPQPYVQERINDIDVVFNVKSYVHIFARHYYPDMNFDEDVSLTPDLNFIDIREMPRSILKLVSDYNKEYPITMDTHYCLFTSKEERYILWLDRKILNETKEEGLEVRSFYKCIRDNDLEKFNQEGSRVLDIQL